MPRSTSGETATEAVSIASMVVLPSLLSLHSTLHRGSRWSKHCLGHFRQFLYPLSYWWRRTACPCPHLCLYPCPAPIAADHCGGASYFPQFMAFCIKGNMSVYYFRRFILRLSNTTPHVKHTGRSTSARKSYSDSSDACAPCLSPSAGMSSSPSSGYPYSQWLALNYVMLHAELAIKAAKLKAQISSESDLVHTVEDALAHISQPRPVPADQLGSREMSQQVQSRRFQPSSLSIPTGSCTMRQRMVQPKSANPFGLHCSSKSRYDFLIRFSRASQG